MRVVNFIEAVNSGKKVNPVEYSQFFYTIKDLMSGDYTLEELVNTKFIIEEKQITITESECDRVLGLVTYSKESKATIKRELGF